MKMRVFRGVVQHGVKVDVIDLGQGHDVTR